MITIVDYGLGNLGSVYNMMRKIGVSSLITSDIKAISKASKILLPGVGSFDSAMEKLTGSDLRAVLEEKAIGEKIPILGICLGMQLLTRGSEEGSIPGLGWIPAYTHKFPHSELKVPHMGWNVVKPSNPSELTKGFEDDFRFYFVHSYYVKTDSRLNSILVTNYGIEFESGIQRDNIFGTQFHPEKSHRFGMHLFRNFAMI